ncbi:MAG: hypothetical protein A2784_00360 [Candidatus Chisholmbacteria bacterium RIFCSPHIGHO2_01_FULL_48_12]|uniref:DUF5652 domain-containing protein n=1 Tax=Candidatus Chisholmbacteria bacterium RIFCSPHIGHO2_01_FULL_48_12 TaxID=1797589 RepID=A0A1G1VUP7_9BACT|nr:MAG: hypothetical protein A2784_00360 [Candidatus Chisholmbacteria bacterium RIFCSPHIGHO2_01_FULL_48_12]
MPFGTGAWAWMLAPLMLWSLFWKGLALWRAARGHQRYWFIALLVINTLGLLEIVYLVAFAKDRLILTAKTKKH